MNNKWVHSAWYQLTSCPGWYLPPKSEAKQDYSGSLFLGTIGNARRKETACETNLRVLGRFEKIKRYSYML